jgi:hypothetical protein
MRGLFMAALMLGLSDAVAGLAAAQGDPGGVAISHTSFIVQSPLMQKELKITRAQNEKLARAFKEAAEMHRDESERIKSLQPVEQGGQFAQLQIKFSRAVDQALAQTLKPEQLRRFKQIHHQRAGIQDPEAQTALKLSAEQKDRIKAILTDTARQRQELFKNPGDYNLALAQSKVLDKQAQGKMLTVLTAGQKKTWKELTGPAFPIDDLTPYQFFMIPPKPGDRQGR